MHAGFCVSLIQHLRGYQAIPSLTVQARNKSLTVLDAGAALNTLSNTGVFIDPAVKAMAQAAAVNAFGLTSKNLQLADGKCLCLSCLHLAATEHLGLRCRSCYAQLKRNLE